MQINIVISQGYLIQALQQETQQTKSPKDLPGLAKNVCFCPFLLSSHCNDHKEVHCKMHSTTQHFAVIITNLFALKCKVASMRKPLSIVEQRRRERAENEVVSNEVNQQISSIVFSRVSSSSFSFFSGSVIVCL